MAASYAIAFNNDDCLIITNKMDRKYDEIEEQSTMASEPLTKYGVKETVRWEVHGCNNALPNLEVVSNEKAEMIDVEALRAMLHETVRKA